MTPAPIVLDARTATPHFPGIGRYVTGLARAFADSPAAPRLLLLRPGTDPVAQGLRGISVSVTPFQLSQHVVLRRVLREHGAALYHSPYYLMPAAPGIPAVVTCHDLIPLVVPGIFDTGQRLVFRLAHLLAFRAASAIIVPSHSTARDLQRYFPRSARKVRMIPLGFDRPCLADVPRARAGVAAAVAAGGPYVLAVGSNKPHKDLGVLVEAWAKMAAADGGTRGVRLVLAGPRDARYGEGAGAEALRREGLLVSLGIVPDQALNELYRRALLFVMPSRAEGFGLPALEAMAFGAPVVCSGTAALAELCGSAAAFFPPGDADALAARLAHLLDTPGERDRLREAGPRRAAAFTWTATARATLELYDRLILEGR